MKFINLFIHARGGSAFGRYLFIGLLCLFCFGTLSGVALAHPEKDSLNKAVDQINKGFNDEMVTADSSTDTSKVVSGLVGRIIKIFLGIIGTIALLVFLYSGIIWMVAGGNETRQKKAQDSLVWAAIGLFVIFASYVFVSYLISVFTF